jgi:hypothetical protein
MRAAYAERRARVHSPSGPNVGIWVGRYAIVGGEVREHGPWLVERQCPRDDDPVRLLVLAEPVDERSSEFCHQVADAVADLFCREALSMTGGLLRALRQAHVNLAEWNRRSLREHRVAVGITCVAIREHEATVAQVGPGVVYVAGPAGPRRLSTDDPAGEAAALPVGGSEPVQPLFHSFAVPPHQLLLLTESAERVLSPTAIAQTLAAGPERALADLFVRTRELDDVTAVLVAELEGAPSQEDVAPVSLASIGPPPEPASGGTVDSGGRVDSDGRAAPERSLPAFPSLRRPRVAGRGRTSEGGVRLPWRAIALAAILLVAVAVGRFVLPSLLNEDRAARLEEAVAAAELHLTSAGAEEDATGQRAEIALALSEIARARSVEPSDPRVADLDARAGSMLSVLDAVVDLDQLRRVIEFQGTLTAPLRPAGLGAGGGALWLVDGERGRLFWVDASAAAGAGPAPVEVYRSGESYGGATARDPLAIAWDAASGRLLLIDAARTLFAIAPPTAGQAVAPAASEPRVLQLRDVADIDSVAAITAYAGNLYLLDPRGGEVWRYLPAGDGYDSERGGLLGGAEIDGAGALLVDGDIFVLQDERLRRFRLGEELAPLLQGVDRPLQSPAGVVEDVARGRLYVADRGGRRVVVSDRDGDFVEQFRHPQFFDLRGLALSDDGAELYVLTGDGIYAFDPLQQQ